jgi:hypothetical protein
MISHEVVTLITVPLPGVTYSFHPDGRAYADGEPHRYFSQPTPPRSGTDVGFMEWTDAEFAEYKEVVLAAGAKWLLDSIVEINAPASTQ